MYKILVIEDDFNLRNNLCEILTYENYEVDFAENGQSGLEKARAMSPDLIISDIMMPGMNGFEVLRILMNDSETASIPFIFLTAKAEPENLRKGMKLGADDYLSKPFIIDDLLEAIKIRLQKKDLNDEKIKSLQQQISDKLPHELRTPLVPILGLAEMMEDESDLTQIKEMARAIRKSGKILHGRIEKFLIYKELVIKENKSKADGNSERTIISNDLITSYITKLPKELKPHRIKSNVENSLIPISDCYLGILITELLENGLKYSKEHNEVRLSGYFEQDRYKITVADKGRGMTENEIKSITAFRKFGENKLSEDGLGLGLTIVRKILDLYQGSIMIKSELNKFTRCEISIPTKCVTV